MEENLTPGGKKAETPRQEEKKLWENMTTKEIIKAAKAVGETARGVIEDNEKFLVKAKEETDKAKNQPK